jgi:hypothetical protein
MKLSTLLIACLLAFKLNAQVEGDSVNIRVIVQDQIKAAQEVLELEKAKLEEYKAAYKSEQNRQLAAVKPAAKTSGGGDDTYFKLYFLLTAIFLAVLIIAYRRKVIFAKAVKSKLLKKNIKLMRDEVPYPSEEDELTSIRKRMLNAVAMSESANDISMGKDNLRLSKGEILLAEKLISKLSNTGNNKSEFINEDYESGSQKKNVDKERNQNKNLNDREITSKAKELKVSREEVMLAELLKKIKSSAA